MPWGLAFPLLAAAAGVAGEVDLLPWARGMLARTVLLQVPVRSVPPTARKLQPVGRSALINFICNPR